MLGALWLTGGFVLVEVAGGLFAGSLALLADAGHMLTDTAALGLACIAVRVATRPGDTRRSYGYHRFPVLAAYVNAVTLLLIVAWIAFEAVARMREPVEILEGPMLAVAAVGLLVNLAAFRLLLGGRKDSLNVRGALVHVLGDLLGSVAAIVAALVIMATGWTLIDPLLSLLVALLVLRSAVSLLRRSGHVLMEGRPEHLDAEDVARTIARTVPEVGDVHHMHIWSLSPGRPIMTFHARVDRGAVHDQVLERVLACLRERFGVRHATVQLEHERCAEPAECAPDAG
ncbi:MAG: cation diffusion facilitator family transporter [Acidobacteria bacterium]|nr:cation diffusion facilitator family transporter [Acidobacteriota bacterium]